MTEKMDDQNKGDYSCEILSFIVIFILSVLSHIWYIFFAICAGIICWGAVFLLGQVWMAAARTFPFYQRRLLLKMPSRTREY